MTTSAQISERRHTDPPALWVTVMLGSVAIHVAGFGMLYWLMERQQTREVGTDPVPVDIIAIAPQNSPVNLPKSGVRRSVPPRRQSSQVISNSKRPIRQAVVHKEQNLPASAATNASPLQSSQLSPRGKQADGRHNSSTSLKRQQENKKVSRLPSQLSGDRESGTGNKKQHETHNSSVTPPSPANNTSTDGRGKNPVPPAPPSSRNTIPSNEKPPATNTSNPQEGGGLVASLSNVTLGNRGRDIPDSPAKPIENQKELDSIHYPSPALKNLKQVLVVRVYLVINDIGKVDFTQSRVVKTCGNREADQQAMEILKNWNFKPAIQGGKPVYGELQVDFRLSPRTS